MKTRIEKAIETICILLIIIISYAGGVYVGSMNKCNCDNKIENKNGVAENRIE